MSAQNIDIIRSGKSEVSTAVDHSYYTVLIRKGPDAADSTIELTAEETMKLSGSLKGQLRVLGARYPNA